MCKAKSFSKTVYCYQNGLFFAASLLQKSFIPFSNLWSLPSWLVSEIRLTFSASPLSSGNQDWTANYDKTNATVTKSLTSTIQSHWPQQQQRHQPQQQSHQPQQQQSHRPQRMLPNI